METNKVSGMIIDAALSVHSTLGPGLLESTYEACLVYELKGRGLRYLNQAVLPISYKAIQIEAGYRIDLLVEDRFMRLSYCHI